MSRRRTRGRLVTRRMRLKSRRRKTLALAIAGAAAVLILSCAALRMEGWRVKVLEVTGTRRVDPERVYDASGIRMGDHMLLFSAARSRREILNVPLVTDARVMRVFPSRIVIAVSEREPYACLASGDACYVVDREAVLLEPAAEKPAAQLLRIRVESLRAEGVGAPVSFAGADRFREVCEALQVTLGARVKSISFAKSGIKVFLDDGFYVLLGAGDGAEEKLSLVPPLIESAAGLGEKFSGLNIRSLENPSFVR
ncbi:MAG: FtsQ-type POTRA domain-containing protein [bacterium]